MRYANWFNAKVLGFKTEAVHIVFVDFRKTFDLVDHANLLTKLAASGVNRGFWKWTQSFLTDRTLQVKVPGALSKVGQVIAGVPQGVVISPLLFNVHINDVDKDIPSSLGIKSCKFADDLTLYQIVPSHSESYTVKPEFCDHPKCHANVVVNDRWSLMTGGC